MSLFRMSQNYLGLEGVQEIWANVSNFIVFFLLEGIPKILQSVPYGRILCVLVILIFAQITFNAVPHGARQELHTVYFYGYFLIIIDCIYNLISSNSFNWAVGFPLNFRDLSSHTFWRSFRLFGRVILIQQNSKYDYF